MTESISSQKSLDLYSYLDLSYSLIPPPPSIFILYIRRTNYLPTPAVTLNEQGAFFLSFFKESKEKNDIP
ncbi:hypothetical protein G7K_6867-t1 [Saitoella complicata NRRL Y-17804]|uniref:Uncharacterized protein n=1 Tax=Saitoella complicata (strain BCRC 22490 / CBS 7301 / JCM 7358 / NBRC 10748 / NRRL Y-17804) TaxID=698492 RepID=A0A0E9NTQ8_SAICN|nr:hypothetical protein G7K_6867-t1 [Saitoella complicata NRRL Y-17804]